METKDLRELKPLTGSEDSTSAKTQENIPKTQQGTVRISFGKLQEGDKVGPSGTIMPGEHEKFIQALLAQAPGNESLQERVKAAKAAAEQGAASPNSRTITTSSTQAAPDESIPGLPATPSKTQLIIAGLVGTVLTVGVVTQMAIKGSKEPDPITVTAPPSNPKPQPSIESPTSTSSPNDPDAGANATGSAKKNPTPPRKPQAPNPTNPKESTDKPKGGDVVDPWGN